MAISQTTGREKTMEGTRTGKRKSVTNEAKRQRYQLGRTEKKKREK